MMSTCIYFAYGSNLLYARLQARTPSLKNIGIGRLNNHKMCFTMPCDDGSGKCGIFESEADYVMGVLYQLDCKEKPILDEIEGIGYSYHDRDIEVEQNGEPVSCFTYYPTDMSCQIAPYDWYKNFVLSGARENHFPQEYIETIENITTQIDSNQQRRKDNFAIAGITV